jgi:N6-adenosine-specific RNA methylase IME4/ParB-like chromosome segregation protein Spo0J
MNMYEAHEEAYIFPQIEGKEFDKLVDDIKANGLLNPIVLYQGKILDGRNRFNACLEAGIQPLFVEYDGDSPREYVISLNLTRRHLTESQRALVSAKLADMKSGTRTDTPKTNSSEVSIQDASKLLNVGTSITKQAKVVLREAPQEDIEAIERGELTVNKAIGNLKKKARLADLQKQAEEISQLKNNFDKKYHVIVLDPPWGYGTEYDPNGRRSANPYPEMSLEEIKKIDIPANEDCVLWLWTTHKFMRHSFDLLDAWGFEDKAILTWVKDRMGLGSWLRSQSEFCIMAVKGKPLINLTNQTTIINGKLREHSRKPDEFYEMVDSLCTGLKIDYFSREQREGWDTYGNDDEKF